MSHKTYSASELAEIRKKAGTIDLGDKVRAEIKDIWDNGIKKYPEVEPLGKALIAQLKRSSLGNPKPTDDVAKARKIYQTMLKSVQEVVTDGTD